MRKGAWGKFKSNKLGHLSLKFFLSLVCITSFAEVIANDKPLILRYNNAFYFPIIKNYPETEFNGDFETATDYRDLYVQELINKNGWMIWPIIRFSYQTINYNLDYPSPTSPSKENLLGTDEHGRDVLARVIYGMRISILFGFALTILCTIIGIIIGSMQGYFGGIIDLLGQRFSEIWSSVPMIFLLIILNQFINPNIFWLLLIFTAISWMKISEIMRAEALKVKNYNYITAARVMGVSELGIIFKHILPNAMTSTISYMPFMFSGSITMLTSLDFLGFGLPPGSASIGEILAQAKANPQAPWIAISGSAVLIATLTSAVFIGQAARDALDPRV